MITVALGELQAPSLHYVLYEMTLVEFKLKLYAYQRIREREDRNFREVAFQSMWAFYRDPKKLPKDINKYWQIGNEEVKTVNNDSKEAFKQAMQKYQLERSGKAES